MTKQYAVAAEGVGRRLESTGEWVLRDCSVGFESGTMTAVVGPSGAGKTTLMYCLSGLDAPSAGRVSLDGADLFAMSAQRRAAFSRTRVGFVFQQYNLVGYLSVAENVVLPLSLAGRRVDRRERTAVLDRFGLAAKASTPASALSGGEQQRVALARAILLGPAVVFADEPTGALDTANSAMALDALREMAISGTCVVMVTHDVDAAARADRVVFMRDGRIAGAGERLSGAQILEGVRRSAAGTAAAR